MKIDIYACNITPDLGCDAWIFVGKGRDPKAVMPGHMLSGIALSRQLAGIDLNDIGLVDGDVLNVARQIEQNGYYVSKSNLAFRNA